MHKTQQLLVRACKSNNPYKRLHSVYRRFYLPVNETEANFHIAGILNALCENYAKPNTAALIRDLNPSNWDRLGVTNPDDYFEAVVRALCSHLRLTARSAFPGLTPPLAMRVQDSVAA